MVLFAQLQAIREKGEERLRQERVDCNSCVPSWLAAFLCAQHSLLNLLLVSQGAS